MSHEILQKIEIQKRQAETVARTIASTASTRAWENFNQIKGKNYDKKTYYRRHGLVSDDVKRSITLVEMTSDFYADAFASPSSAALMNEFFAQLKRFVNENKLPVKPKTPPEVEDELTELHRQYRKAIYVDFNEAEARRLAILIRQKSEELVEVTHMKGAFSMSVV